MAEYPPRKKHVTAGQYQVRTQCEPDAATSDRALHGTDDWQRQAGQLMHDRVEQIKHGADQRCQSLAMFAKLADIAPDAELLTACGNEQGTDIRVAGPLYHCLQVVSHGRADHVAPLGLVQDHMTYAVANFPENQIRHQVTFLS